MLLTVFMYVLTFPTTGSLCITLDLVPLVWKLGFGYESSTNENSLVPGHVISINVPTLCLELRWASHDDLARAKEIMEAAPEPEPAG